ncbi:MAG: ATP-dependent DNA helicase [Pyrobaculum sp.]
MVFPYDAFRPFQKEIFSQTYQALANRRPAVINAPTGLGKTAAVLSAAVKYMMETGVSIHYAVRTRNELGPPLRELLKIREKVEIDYVVIKSRQDMCCYPQLKKLDYLEFLAECALLKRQGSCRYYPPRDVDISVKNVYSYAHSLCEAGVCPYEYARQRLEQSQVVISTYFYLFSRERPRDRVVIIDEAHSVLDAVTSLYAIRLYEREVKAAYRECRKYGFLKEAVEIYRLLAFMRRHVGVVDMGDLLALLEGIQLDEAIWEITNRKAKEGRNPYTPLLAIRKLKDREKVRYFTEVREVDGVKALVMTPIEPLQIIKPVLEEAHNVVYLSGTLPISIYTEALGLRSYDAIDISFRQYVPRENYRSIVDMGVTTRFQERGEEMYVKIAERLAAVVNLSPRGVLAVFPSYEVLRGVKKYLKFTIPHWYEGVQEVDLGDLPQKFFLGAVAGGRYVEGVEYVRGGENLLSVVAIVGVPYPEPTPYLEKRVESLKPRLRDRAWAAVYLYQAVVNVRQAVGRLFRSPQDRGLLAFLDRRYAEPELWNSLADILEGSLVVSHVDEAAGEIRQFLSL